MTKFWKPLLAIALICALALAGLGLAAQSPAAAAQAERADEFRAVWVATVYRLDYPSQATTDPAVLKRDADAILQGCVDMGMNAVILQVRPSADALYPSELYPWSKYLTGAQGTAPKNGFDPLAYWVERAHALGLELHAWVNPFRITKGGAAEFQALTADHPAKLHPDWVVEYEGDYYFNPGLPEVREYIVRGAEELARKYDIDGIHLDDYFYPGSGFADGAAYAKYGKGFSNIGDWRRDNVNQLVKTLGERIHAIDPGLSYGISPSGVWADKSSLPQGSNTTGGYESYYASYADSRKWVKEGWIDYICPQIYWYIGHKSMDYATVARWWADTVKGTGVSLYIGMADYLAGNSDPKSPWYGTTAIERQLALNDTLPQVAGEAHFRYRLMAENLAQSRGIDAAFLRAEELLHRWPGCDRLTISLAMTLNGLFFTLGVAEPEPYERRLEPLYRALADSEEPDIRDQALHLLIGRHMRREEYAAAEELLSALSDRWPHRDALQAGLLRRTGRGEEAAELWERRLLNAATEVYESLVSLQELALQAERLEDGARLAALIEETVERYALIPGVASSGRLQQAAAEGDKTAALSALRDMLEALNRSWDGGGLYPHLLPGTQVAVGSVLLPGLLLELQREPELAFLQDEPEFQALLKRYGGGTH